MLMGFNKEGSNIVEKLCGFEVSSSQVSKASELLDDEIEVWRNRELGEYPYLILHARYEKVEWVEVLFQQLY